MAPKRGTHTHVVGRERGCKVQEWDSWKAVWENSYVAQRANSDHQCCFSVVAVLCPLQSLGPLEPEATDTAAMFACQTHRPTECQHRIDTQWPHPACFTDVETEAQRRAGSWLQCTSYGLRPKVVFWFIFVLFNHSPPPPQLHPPAKGLLQVSTKFLSGRVWGLLGVGTTTRGQVLSARPSCRGPQLESGYSPPHLNNCDKAKLAPVAFLGLHRERGFGVRTLLTPCGYNWS